MLVENPLGLSLDMLLVLTTLAIASVLLISAAIRVDVAAVLVLVTLGVFKLLPPDQLFSGFSSEAVISLIAIMIMLPCKNSPSNYVILRCNMASVKLVPA